MEYIISKYSKGIRQENGLQTANTKYQCRKSTEIARSKMDLVQGILIPPYIAAAKSRKQDAAHEGRGLQKLNTFVLPVNETKGILVSRAIAWPISAPPQKAVKIALGKLFFSNTLATILVIAIVINGVVGAPFLQ